MNSALRLPLVLFAIVSLVGCQATVEESEPAAEQEQEKMPPRQEETKKPPIEFPEYLEQTADEISEVRNLLNHWPRARKDWNDPDSYFRTYNALQSILQMSEGSDRERTAARLLSTDYIAIQMTRHIPYPKEPADWGKKSKKLERLGLYFVKGSFSANWEYSSNLLSRAAHEYGDTKWGEFAFSQVYAPDRRGCPWIYFPFKGFETVQTFLETHPTSQYRHGLTLYLAQKYEAHWSFSHATANPDDYGNALGATLDAADYTEGANEAREKAIRRYEEYLELASSDIDVSEIEKRLRKLKAGIDTELWKKVCFRD